MHVEARWSHSSYERKHCINYKRLLTIKLTQLLIQRAAPASGTRPGCAARGVRESYPGQTTFYWSLLGFIGFHWGRLESTDTGAPGHRPARPLPGAQGEAAADERRRHPPRPCPGPSEPLSLLYCEMLPLIWSGGISLSAIRVYWALSGPVAFAI